MYEDIGDIVSLEICDNKIINQSNSSSVLGGFLILTFVHIKHKVETLVIVITYEDFFKVGILQKDALLRVLLLVQNSIFKEKTLLTWV